MSLRLNAVSSNRRRTKFSSTSEPFAILVFANGGNIYQTFHSLYRRPN